MKTNEVLPKEFENVGEKKVDSLTRFNILKDRYRRLAHRRTMITDRKDKLIQKLIDMGVAFTELDPKFNQPGRNDYLGMVVGEHMLTQYFTKKAGRPSNVQDIIDFVESEWPRIRHLNNVLKKMAQTIKASKTKLQNKGKLDRWS